MILVAAPFKSFPFEILSYFHRSVIVLFSRNSFASIEVFGVEKKLIYCFKLSVTGIKSLPFIKECSFAERRIKKLNFIL